MLVTPSIKHLVAYESALRRGWSPDNLRDADAAKEQIEAIERDPEAFVRSLDDPGALGEPIKLPDCSLISRLPSIVRWVWDGDIAGSIGFRWQPGTSILPAHVLGHIGFFIVPWRRDRGYAKHALAIMLGEARLRGLDAVELTTTTDNIASQRVMVANGAVFINQFKRAASYGGGEGVRFRIML